MADDSGGYRSVNPLFMKYTPTNGKFSGQLGYGYRYTRMMSDFRIFHDMNAFCCHFEISTIYISEFICRRIE